MIKEAISKNRTNKEDLTYDEAYSVMNEIMSGRNNCDAERCISCSFVNQKCQSRNNR